MLVISTSTYWTSSSPSHVELIAHSLLCRRKLQDSSADGLSDGAVSDGEEAQSREDIRRDLLLGHMLALLTEGGDAMPAHALPALASSLVDSGLLPRWVQVGSPFWPLFPLASTCMNAWAAATLVASLLRPQLMLLSPWQAGLCPHLLPTAQEAFPQNPKGKPFPECQREGLWQMV
jgi:hypothetical protein